MNIRSFRGVLMAIAILSSAIFVASAAGSRDSAVPRYAHIFVIVEENKDYSEIMNGNYAPNIVRLAGQYGNATSFYGEVHPSQGNYVALLGGDTFGIHDDDAFYCRPGMKNVYCPNAMAPGYANHTVSEPNLASQLEHAGFSWKGYYESIPAAGSKAVFAGDSKMGTGAEHLELYAAKHSGFMNFASTQNDPRIGKHIVGFGQFNVDLKSGQVPAFALVIPNQCNEMHGLDPARYTKAIAAAIPPDCNIHNMPGLIRRGDAMSAKIVSQIQASPAWRSPQNVAIVITFDESASYRPEGCCGIDPSSAANFGGGHIPTIVITNHGPRGAVDPTPYSHYSLLRTLEDAFGIHQYLGHAADTSHGVEPMVPLFSIRK